MSVLTRGGTFSFYRKTLFRKYLKYAAFVCGINAILLFSLLVTQTRQQFVSQNNKKIIFSFRSRRIFATRQESLHSFRHLSSIRLTITSSASSAVLPRSKNPILCLKERKYYVPRPQPIITYIRFTPKTTWYCLIIAFHSICFKGNARSNRVPRQGDLVFGFDFGFRLQMLTFFLRSRAKLAPTGNYIHIGKVNI